MQSCGQLLSSPPKLLASHYESLGLVNIHVPQDRWNRSRPGVPKPIFPTPGVCQFVDEWWIVPGAVEGGQAEDKLLEGDAGAIVSRASGPVPARPRAPAELPHLLVEYLTNLVAHPKALLAHPTNLVAHPKKLLAHPRALIAHPTNLVAHVRALVAHPTKMVAHPTELVAHPKKLLAHARTLVAHPTKLVAHAKAMVVHPTKMVAHPRTWLAHPRKILARPTNLVAHPRKMVAHPTKLPGWAGRVRFGIHNRLYVPLQHPNRWWFALSHGWGTVAEPLPYGFLAVGVRVVALRGREK